MTKQILIIGPSWLGDMVMAQALFKILKQQCDCIIDVLAPDWSRTILDKMPKEVANSISMPIGHGKLALGERYKLAKALAKKQYDQAIVLPNSWKSALIPFWANIPKRTGWLGELRWGLLNDVRYLNKKALPQMVQRYAALAYAENEFKPNDIPYPELVIDNDQVEKLIKKLKLNIGNKKILALCPGAAFGTAKCWPVDYFADLAAKKITEGWQVFLFGSVHDAAVTNKIKAKLNNACIDFAGKISLSETVDLLSAATVVVSNDSGLMHVASSLHKSLIAIYGATSPKFAPPLSNNAKIIFQDLTCSPCAKRDCPLQHHKCMKDITPDRVLDLINMAV